MPVLILTNNPVFNPIIDIVMGRLIFYKDWRNNFAYPIPCSYSNALNTLIAIAAHELGASFLAPILCTFSHGFLKPLSG